MPIQGEYVSRSWKSTWLSSRACHLKPVLTSPDVFVALERKWKLGLSLFNRIQNHLKIVYSTFPSIFLHPILNQSGSAWLSALHPPKIELNTATKELDKANNV